LYSLLNLWQSISLNESFGHPFGKRFRDYFEARVSKEISLPVANKVHSMRETTFPLADVNN
jgi:hypothetical protein